MANKDQQEIKKALVELKRARSNTEKQLNLESPSNSTSSSPKIDADSSPFDRASANFRRVSVFSSFFRSGQNFPQLQNCGGFIMHRAKTGGQNRPLTALQCIWYNISDLKKEVSGGACIYIRPIQATLDTRAQKSGAVVLDGPTVNCLTCKQDVEISNFKKHHCASTSKQENEVIEIEEIAENEQGGNKGDDLDDFDVDDFFADTFGNGVETMAQTEFTRNKLIEEQDKEYAQSLAADREKENKKQVEEQSKEEVVKFREKCKIELTEEPDVGNDVVVNFVGSQESSTLSFHMQSPSSCSLNSISKRQSLSELGINKPCIFNVYWDGNEPPLEQQGINVPNMSNATDFNYAQPNNEETTAVENGTGSDDVVKAKIRRTFIIKDMISTFSDSEILGRRIEIIPVNERGQLENADDLGGVYRDILSAFWAEIIEASFTGETEMVPVVRHDYHEDDWKAAKFF
eukprot:gene12410-13694_t